MQKKIFFFLISNPNVIRFIVQMFSTISTDVKKKFVKKIRIILFLRVMVYDITFEKYNSYYLHIKLSCDEYRHAVIQIVFRCLNKRLLRLSGSILLCLENFLIHFYAKISRFHRKYRFFFFKFPFNGLMQH